MNRLSATNRLSTTTLFNKGKNNYFQGTIRDFEAFFKGEGFSRSEATRLASKLKKTEGFYSRDGKKTSSAGSKGTIQTVRIISDDSNRVYTEVYKLSRQVHYLTELCKDAFAFEDVDPRDEAISEAPEIEEIV